MKIAIGNDHAAVEMKHYIKTYLTSLGHEVLDEGTHDDASVDYPDFAHKVAVDVQEKKVDFGILICGTGIGMSIAANKEKGIRAALIYDQNTASLAKAHNHANIITFGARTSTFEHAKMLVDTYMSTEIETRHEKRLNKIHQREGL